MKALVYFLALALQGFILGISGLTIATWQYWAVTALTGVAAVALVWRNV